jgi:hypothetical protein
MAFHGLAFFRLLWDERTIRFRSENEEQLWRFFSRRGGMGRLEMQQALKYGRWVRVPAGQLIAQGPEARLRFFVLVEGQASITSTYHGIKSEPRPLISGNCFDMGELAACQCQPCHAGCPHSSGGYHTSGACVASASCN